jgi:hypothetical protein
MDYLRPQHSSTHRSTRAVHIARELGRDERASATAGRSSFMERFAVNYGIAPGKRLATSFAFDRVGAAGKDAMLTSSRSAGGD